MRQGSMKVFVSVIVLLLLGFTVEAPAQSQEYERPKPESGQGPPTSLDLKLYEGAQKTVVVQILNLTPYPIQFKSSSITSEDELDMQNRERETNKSFMFAPVGIPRIIPPATANARPYSMVFSWVDDPAFMTDNWVKWTVKNVEYCTVYDEAQNKCVGDDGDTRGPNWLARDVDVGFWMYRLEPPPSEVKSSFLPVLSKVLLIVFKTGLLLLEPENPLAWVEEFLALKELGTTVKEFDTNGSSEEQNQAFGDGNTQWDDGVEMYVASYVIPHPQSICYSDVGCAPSPMKEASGDGVYALWPAGNSGPCDPVCPKLAAEAELTVTGHLVRGQSAPKCPVEPEYGSHTCGLGRAPMFMITIMKTTEFLAGKVAAAATANPVVGATAGATNLDKMRLFLLKAGAGKIRAMLLREGRPGLLALREVVEQLSPRQREVLREMAAAMASGRNPTKDERDLIHSIGAALQNRLK